MTDSHVYVNLDDDPSEFGPAKDAAKALMTARVSASKEDTAVVFAMVTAEARRILEPLQGLPVPPETLATVTRRLSLLLLAQAWVGVAALTAGVTGGIHLRDISATTEEAQGLVVECIPGLLAPLYRILDGPEMGW